MVKPAHECLGAARTGVYDCEPRGNTKHAFRESLELGDSALDEGQALRGTLGKGEMG